MIWSTENLHRRFAGDGEEEAELQLQPPPEGSRTARWENLKGSCSVKVVNEIIPGSLEDDSLSVSCLQSQHSCVKGKKMFPFIFSQLSAEQSDWHINL